MNSEPLLSWIKERETIRVRRASGEPPPWTDNPILREWSFTNVRREDDRVTRWIADNWREPHTDDPVLWFAMAVARNVNEPDTLAEIGYPVPWRPAHYVEVIEGRMASGQVAYGSAYKIIVSGKSGSRPRLQVEHLYNPLWASRECLRPKRGRTLAEYHAKLEERPGLGGFLAAQIIADLKYVAPLNEADDWATFAASGPGSRRGLNRVLGRPVEARWREHDWRCCLRQLHRAIQPDLERMGWEICTRRTSSRLSAKPISICASSWARGNQSVASTETKRREGRLTRAAFSFFPCRPFYFFSCGR